MGQVFHLIWFSQGGRAAGVPAGGEGRYVERSGHTGRGLSVCPKEGAALEEGPGATASEQEVSPKARAENCLKILKT